MILARVRGNLWSTRKDEKLNGWKFMVVEILDGKSQSTGTTLVACDNAGAGIGDLVLITTGSAARKSAQEENLPIDAMIVGVVDGIE